MRNESIAENVLPRSNFP